MTKNYGMSSSSSDSDESTEYNADVILNRLKNPRSVVDPPRNQWSDSRIVTGEKKGSMANNKGDEEFAKMLKESLDINKFESAIRDVEFEEPRKDESEMTRIGYEQYRYQFLSNDQYSKSETSSDYTDPVSEDSTSSDLVVAQRNSSQGDRDPHDSTSRELNENSTTNSESASFNKGDKRGKTISLSKYKRKGEENRLCEKSYKNYCSGDYEEADVNIHEECYIIDQVNGMKEEESDDDIEGEQMIKGEIPQEDKESVWNNYEQKDNYKGCYLRKADSDYELEALEMELQLQEDNDDDLASFKKNYNYFRTLNNVALSCNTTEHQLSRSDTDVSACTSRNCEQDEKISRRKSEADQNSVVSPVENKESDKENEEIQRRRELEERLFELHAELTRMRKELNETKQRNMEEAAEIELAARRLEEGRMAKMYQEMEAYHIIPTIDLPSGWDIGRETRDEWRTKRVAAAAEYRSKLKEVEVLCTDELGKLEKAMEKLEPLNRMASYWPSKTVQVSSSSRDFQMEMATRCDVSSNREETLQRVWSRERTPYEVVS